MRLSRFFIDRPIFAAVLSVLLTILGVIAYRGLPVAEYPEIAPPTVVVSALYPGASAVVIAETVATPIEQEINGVDGMLYIVSQSTGDGRVSINVVFRPGIDIDQAQILVQNRLAVAEARLPEEVRRLGVTVRKASPDLMMVIHMLSPDGSRDEQYVSNYATLYVKDVLARIDGVGDVQVFGARDYAMRIWLDPAKVAARGMTAGEVVDAVRAANVQVAAGAINQPPAVSASGFEVSIQALGRLSAPEQFAGIVIRSDPVEGAVTRLGDVARVELGAQDYTVNSYLDNEPATAIVIFQRPGSNALATSAAVQGTVAGLARGFPAGVGYRIVYNPTVFIQQSIDAVFVTFLEAVALVVLVVILFLQSWRAAIIPIVAIPVSIVGTFVFLSALGIGFNTLSLFGLVLAIGIVVDDAIVVVENVERYLAQGFTPREAARMTMDEVGGALVAIALVLGAVFIPTAFIAGLQGAFYRQFAVTIAASTAISACVSLTLSPAMAALILKPRGNGRRGGVIGLLGAPLRLLFRGFDAAFGGLAEGYAWLTRHLVRLGAIVLVAYAALLGLTYLRLVETPTGLIPPLDRGYFIVAFQLPPGSTLARTDAVVRHASDVILSRPGVESAVAFVGFDGATFTNAPNAGVVFVSLESFEERIGKGMSSEAILADLRQRMAAIQEAFILVIEPPSVPGIGIGGGLKLYVQDRAGRGYEALEGAAWAMAGSASQVPGIAQAFTLFNTKSPQVFADIDRTKAEMLGVPVGRVFEALSIYNGSAFVNDFNILGRIFRVTAQADDPFRLTVADVASLRTRSDAGEMVPIGSVATFRDTTGPYRVARYNLYPAAEVQLALVPGFSTGQAIAAVEQLAATRLPSGFGFEWTEIALQEKLAGDTAILAFGLAVTFVFLLLAALYESWLLPLAVVLIVPMCILAAMTGVTLRGLDRNILVEIGLVVLVGLAAKNAILIVEFARQGEERGLPRREAAVEAARTRLRPILMTSVAFILGVVPLVLAEGAGAEMRQSLGTAVFAGMAGVTGFGLIFTPVFYVVCSWLGGRHAGKKDGGVGRQAGAPPPQSP